MDDAKECPSKISLDVLLPHCKIWKDRAVTADPTRRPNPVNFQYTLGRTLQIVSIQDRVPHLKPFNALVLSLGTTFANGLKELTTSATLCNDLCHHSR